MSCTLQRKHITIKRKTASDVSRQYSSSDPVKRSAAAAAVADNQMTIYWLMSSVWWSNLSSNMLFMNLWLLPRLTQPSNEVKEVRRQQKWSLQRHSVMLSLCTSSPRLLLNSSSSSPPYCVSHFFKIPVFFPTFLLYLLYLYFCPLNHACLVLSDTNSICSSFFSRICTNISMLSSSSITIFTTIWGCSGFCALCPGSLSSLVT